MSLSSTVFQLVAAIAVQQALDRNYDKLITPSPDDAELHWLDHRQAVLEQVGRIKWEEVPRCLRPVGLAVTAGQVSLLHMIYWGWGRCFGDFKITDNVQQIQWQGDDALIKPLGMLCLGGAAVQRHTFRPCSTDQGLMLMH